MNIFPFPARMSHHGTSKMPRRLNRAIVGLLLVLSSVLVYAAVAQDSPLGSREDDRVRGDHRALITLLEYSDFTCGYCEKFFQETWPLLFTDYVRTGKVRLVYRDYPRAVSGPSVETALAARCAGEQGQYWAMHDRLFSSGNKFSSADVRQHAEALQIDLQRFNACVDEARYTKDIYADRITADQFRIRGTPHFVLYVTDDPQEAVVIPGAFPYEVFKEEIDKLLETVSSRVSSDAL